MSGGFKEASRRGHKQIFETVTLENQSAQTDANGDILRDEHGNIKWDDKTTMEVPGEITTKGQPSFNRRVDGIDRDFDAIVWITDDEGTMTSGEDDEAVKATRVVVDARRYKVNDVFDERNGRLRGHVEVEQ